MKLKLYYYGDSELRVKAEPVEKFDEEIQQIIKAMVECMYQHNGMGLAGPQVGVFKRIFIHTVRGVDKYGYPVYGAPKVYINPKISIVGDEEWTESEGCLSFPKIYEDVVRPYRIKVEALDETGKPFTEEHEGWMARPILHENDHLNGVLFIDRISAHRKKALSHQLKKIKKKFSSKDKK